MTGGGCVSIGKWLGSGELSIKNKGKPEYHPFHKMDNGDKMNANSGLINIKVLATNFFSSRNSEQQPLPISRRRLFRFY
jgi:hypothetical protein